MLQGIHRGTGTATFDQREHIAGDDLAAQLPLRQSSLQPGIFYPLRQFHKRTPVSYIYPTIPHLNPLEKRRI